MATIEDIKKKKKEDISAAKEKDTPRKEIRDIREQGREDIRAAKAEDIVKKEASAQGIDIDALTKTPIGVGAKERITKDIQAAANKDLVKDIEGYSKAYIDPALEKAPDIDKERLLQSAKRQRRARWADALYSFGEGLQGRTADPRALMSTRLERERSQQFQDYRSVRERNKRTQQLWENQYRKDLLGFIDQKLKDKKLSEAERVKFEQAQAKTREGIRQFEEEMKLKREQLEARKTGRYYSPKTGKQKPVYTEQLESGAWQITNEKNPYSDLYYKLTGNSPTIINEVAKLAGHATTEEGSLKTNLRPEEVERFSNTLLSKVFDVSTDEAGNRIATPKPGMENFMQDLSAKINQLEPLQKQLDSLMIEKLTAVKEAGRLSKDDVKADYDQRISALQQQLDTAQSDVQQMLGGSTPSIEQPKTEAGSTTKSKLDKYFN